MQNLLDDRLFEGVMEMAGYFAADGVVGVSSGEILMPFVAYQGGDGKRRLVRLAMGSVEAVVTGEKKLSNLDEQDDGAVLVKDGLITLETGKTDCLLVDVRFNDGGSRQLQIVIPYRNAGHAEGFAVHKPMVSSWQGVDDAFKPVFIGAFQTGLKSHGEAMALWAKHYVETPGKSSDFHGQESSQFSQDEFELLRRVPFVVFLMVACSDGKLDQKEVAKFVELLASSGKYENPLITRIITNVITDIPAMLNVVIQEQQDISTLLRDVRRIVDARAGSEAGEAFAHVLLAMGHDIASASGGFFGFGSKISKDEKTALAHLAVYLGLIEQTRA